MRTIKTEDAGIVYHQLQDCAYERGAAIAIYMFNGRSKHRPQHSSELQLTDICFDRTSGRLWGAEPDDRLTLVKHGEDGDQYEVILPDTRPFERWSVNIGNYEDGYGTVNFHYDRPTSEKLNWANTGTQLDGNVTLHGYAFKTLPNTREMTSDFKVQLSGNDAWGHARARDEQHRGRQAAPYMQFEGHLRFDGKMGTAEMKATTKEGKNGRGELVLMINDKGEISGSGTLTLENARIAGGRSDDWKTTSWEIRKIVGHLVGEDGEQFRAVGIAGGQTVDQDGFVNPVHASIDITGYSRRIAELWEESSDFDGE